MDLSVIIVNWNTCELLAQCLHSLYSTIQNLDIEIFVVDNASVDGSVEMVRKSFAKVLLIENAENVGFVRANNQAMDLCNGRYVLLLNSDTRVLSGSIEESVRFMDEHPNAGVAGTRLLNSDGSFQASYSPFPNLWREFLNLSTLGRWLIQSAFPSRGPQTEKGPQKIKGYVEGAYMMARRQNIDQIGGLDENIFMYTEDVDWCYRFHQAGWEIWYLPQTPIIHYGGQSSKKCQTQMEAELYRSRVYFFSKHYGKISAFSLKVLIYTLTITKLVVHGMLRFFTNGRIGRTVTSLQELHLALYSIDSPAKQRTAP